MRIRHQHTAWQCYADLLMCLLMWGMMCIALLIISVHVQSKGKLDAHPVAEYLVTLTWDDTRNVDLDLWVRDPFGHVVYYLTREAVNVSLDRDSRGYVTNRQVLENGRVIVSGNREVTTIRAIVPGDYLVAVAYYNGGDDNHSYTFSPPDPLAAIDYKVRLEKVNPTLKTEFEDQFHFTHIKEGENAVAFHVDEDGKVTILPLPAENLIAEHGGVLGTESPAERGEPRRDTF